MRHGAHTDQVQADKNQALRAQRPTHKRGAMVLQFGLWIKRLGVRLPSGVQQHQGRDQRKRGSRP